MKSMKKIGIWGQFGDGGLIADGQAVRTTIITQEMKSRYGEDNLMILNTNRWKRHPISFFYGTIKLLASCDKIVIFPADNGFKTVVPIYDFLNAFYRRELYDVVIGGYLPNLLKNKRRYLHMLKKYNALFVQTTNLKRDLETLGLNQVHILSNLKRLNTVHASEVVNIADKQVNVFTMSRINESKGIDDAFSAVKLANKKLGGAFIHLIVYGIIATEYEEHFKSLLTENREFASYGGVVPYDKTVEELKDKFLMLFPTSYYGEGFPGNVVDAYNSAMPIIATDWMYNKDIIQDGINGILVPIHDPQAICEALLKFYNDRNYRTEISLNNLKEAEKYQPDKVLEVFYRFIDSGREKCD